ncbi:MAG TPA: hypothetical protein VMH39_09555, partial [Gemmatimonadaceae bacterium]|nr:hypothetical protein [Gemmatimonadaceae bacterium]
SVFQGTYVRRIHAAPGSARIDLIGSRSWITVVFDSAKTWLLEPQSFIPSPISRARDFVALGQDFPLLHPLSPEAGPYYRFRARGDTLHITLGDGRAIDAVAINVIPVGLSPRLIRGYMLIDAGTGALVLIDAQQAAATPIEFGDRLQRMESAGLNSMTVDHTVVEYELRDHLWLPHRAVMSSTIRVGDQIRVVQSTRFVVTYDSINPAGAPDVPTAADTAHGVFACRACPDDLSDASPGHLGSTLLMIDPQLGRVAVHIAPEDSLLRSPELPGRAFTRVDSSVDWLRAATGGAGGGTRPLMPLDPAGRRWLLPPSDGLLRFNRVEGLSAGLGVEQGIGLTDRAGIDGRYGFADRETRGDVWYADGDLRVSAYRRLDISGEVTGANSASLYLGSVGTLLDKQDTQWYFDATGADATVIQRVTARVTMEWRVFGERESSLTRHAFVPLLGGKDSLPPVEPINDGFYGGLDWTMAAAAGAPNAELRNRIELAAVDGRGVFGQASLRSAYTTGAGPFTAMVVGGLGSTIGVAPVQTFFHLGGMPFLAGYSPGAISGSAWWSGTAIAGVTVRHFLAIAPGAVYNVGWVGPRTALGTTPPERYAGVGLSILHNVFRVDYLKLLGAPDARRSWRLESYTTLF